MSLVFDCVSHVADGCVRHSQGMTEHFILLVIEINSFMNTIGCVCHCQGVMDHFVLLVIGRKSFINSMAVVYNDFCMTICVNQILIVSSLLFLLVEEIVQAM